MADVGPGFGQPPLSVLGLVLPNQRSGLRVDWHFAALGKSKVRVIADAQARLRRTGSLNPACR